MSYDKMAEINLDNHKLVIVMDHSPYFTTSSDPNKWLNSFCHDVIPVIPKSLWACMVESVMEFTRIVWNVFPKDKLIQIIISNHLAHILNNWETDTQSTEYLSEAFSSIGVPRGETPTGQEASILHGLRGALDSLITYTPLQTVKFFDDLACMAKTQYAKLNRGRIICITSLSSELDLKVLTNLFILELAKYNYNASHSNFQQLPVTHCHLIIINIYPSGLTCDIVDQPPHQFTADLKLELHTVDVKHISEKMAQLLVLEYNLACTVIGDVPSLNFCNHDIFYDAEMFHPRDVHLDMANEYPEAVYDVRIQGSFFTKMRLLWSYHPLEVTDIITSMTRITPADIQSPGTVRLIKHLYSGKKILLEYPLQNRSIIKYMLAVQDGDIFLHTLMMPREVLALKIEETKSYRDVGDAKTKSSTSDAYQSLYDTSNSKYWDQNKCNGIEITTESDVTNYYESKTVTDETYNTKTYLPIVGPENIADENIPFKQSVLYSPYVKQLMLNLLSTFIRFRLTRNQVDMCCHSIGEMKSNELNHFTLNLPRDNFYKSVPKSKQYQVLWNELQQFLEENLFSVDHEVIYNFFREVVKGERLNFGVYGIPHPVPRNEILFPAPKNVIRENRAPNEAPANDTQEKRAPVKSVAEKGVSVNDTVVKGVLYNGRAEKEAPEKKVSVKGIPKKWIPEKRTPEKYAPEQKAAEKGISKRETSENGAISGLSLSSEDPVEDTTRRLRLLDFLVQNTDKTQRKRKDKKRGKPDK